MIRFKNFASIGHSRRPSECVSPNSSNRAQAGINPALLMTTGTKEQINQSINQSLQAELMESGPNTFKEE